MAYLTVFRYSDPSPLDHKDKKCFEKTLWNLYFVIQFFLSSLKYVFSRDMMCLSQNAFFFPFCLILLENKNGFKKKLPVQSWNFPALCRCKTVAWSHRTYTEAHRSSTMWFNTWAIILILFFEFQTKHLGRLSPIYKNTQVVNCDDIKIQELSLLYPAA
jgi:hypothetical protein